MMTCNVNNINYNDITNNSESTSKKDVLVSINFLNSLLSIEKGALDWIGAPMENYENFQIKKCDITLSLKVKEVLDLLNDNENIEKICYMDNCKEFWLIVKDSSLKEQKQIIRQLNEFIYNNLQYKTYIIKESQIIWDEFPKTDVEIIRGA